MPVEPTELNSLLRQLPQVEQVLAAPELAPALQGWRRDVIKRIVQQEISAAREELKNKSEPGAAASSHRGGTGAEDGGLASPVPSPQGIPLIAARVLSALAQLDRSLIRPVVNATGVVLHTNLGRAVLSPSAQAAVTAAVSAVATGYSNLELDLDTGKRTRRDVTLEPLLTALTGAQSATVVNNCAAAVFLTLHTLAGGREVITSRGELVEIGGSFRVPDIVRESGCTLVEVGTTNRTRLSDYETAITDNTALILKTHRSNFELRGFTEDTAVEELAALGRKRGIPVVVDLGSGYLAAEGEAALTEPTIADMLAAGADLVLFSGDKLLGGPQAGIIVGRADLIKRLRGTPLWRALRIDKLTVAALGATLLDHLHGGGQSPTYPARVLERDTLATANELAAAVNAARPDWKVEVIEAPGSWGGGSLPEEAVASHAVVISAPGLSADQLDQALRTGEPPIAGYIIAGRYALNVLTLLPDDIERISRAIRAWK